MPACQVFGWLTIALGVVALCGVVANISGKNLGGHSLAPLASVVVLSISVGLVTDISIPPLSARFTKPFLPNVTGVIDITALWVFY